MKRPDGARRSSRYAPVKDFRGIILPARNMPELLDFSALDRN
jgi:hypothetical protein